MRGLNGLRTLVTGAAGGIGRAISERLLEEGARLAVTDLEAPQGYPDGVLTVGADVTSEDELQRAVDAAERHLDGIDALVACAGIHWTGPTHEMSVDDFERVVAVSATGTFLAIRAVLPGMLSRRSGRIVTLGSTASLVGASGLSAYAAAKGAVLQLTRSVATEYAGRGIRANCLCPGATDTPLLRRLMANREDPEAFARAHPIGRFASASEIAGVAAFLLSDDASYTVGAAVVSDGGFTAT